MEVDAIVKEHKPAVTNLRRDTKEKFKEVLLRVSETDPDEFHKEEEEVSIIEGPVSGSFRTSLDAEQVIENLPPAKTIASEIINELKPKLISISLNGLSKTTIWIKTDALNEIEVEIDHYDTDPSKFYLTFRGNEEAQKIMSAHQALLATSLKRALPSFHCVISSPTYIGEYSKRKKSEKNKKNSLVKTARVRYSAINSEV